MAIKKTDKYADFKYQLSDTEKEEALWLIEQGDFKDLEEFTEFARRGEIGYLTHLEAEKKKTARLNKKLTELKKTDKAA